MGLSAEEAKAKQKDGILDSQPEGMAERCTQGVSSSSRCWLDLSVLLQSVGIGVRTGCGGGAGGGVMTLNESLNPMGIVLVQLCELSQDVKEQIAAIPFCDGRAAAIYLKSFFRLQNLVLMLARSGQAFAHGPVICIQRG